MDLKQLVTGKKGDNLFLLGNEAAVRGAIESGVSISSTYPGTPSSEIGNILSLLAKDAEMYFEFSINEKVAMEVAASSAASGVRSFTFMKHVGLNVASDSFVSAVYTGVRGGMVILSADDPSIFSSQNEQDNRNYARLANLPTLEPSNPQEIKDMMKFGFDLSEQFEIPVLIRTTTRVSHMRGIVELDDVRPQKTNSKDENSHWKKGFFKKDPKRFVPVPDNALLMHKNLVSKIKEITSLANYSDLNISYNFNSKNNSLKFGIIASGSAFNYAYDIINENDFNIDILKLGFSYPFPEKQVFDFVKDLDGIFIAEEVDPILEKEVLAILGQHNLEIPVFGKLNGFFPLIYEFTPDIVKNSLTNVLDTLDNLKIKNKHEILENIESISKNINDKQNNNENSANSYQNHELNELIQNLPSRPPSLCPGCSHRSTYYSAKKAAKELKISDEDLIFSSDIGCYTLGVSPPYKTADYLLSMGSSIGDACGFTKATNQKIISFIGDSTFFHGGIPPLINAVHNNGQFVVTVLDNRTTAMTGGQPNPGLPVDGMGDLAPAISIEEIAKSCGCKFVKTINPINLKKSIEVYKEALNYDGIAVIIAKYPCTLIKGQKRKKPMKIKEESCNKCFYCVDVLACPAISKIDDKVVIDDSTCKGCTTCVQICKDKAIGVKKD